MHFREDDSLLAQSNSGVQPAQFLHGPSASGVCSIHDCHSWQRLARLDVVSIVDLWIFSHKLLHVGHRVVVVFELFESEEVFYGVALFLAGVFWHAIRAATDDVDRDLGVIVNDFLASLYCTADVDTPGCTTIDAHDVLAIEVEVLRFESEGNGGGCHGSIEFVLFGDRLVEMKKITGNCINTQEGNTPLEIPTMVIEVVFHEVFQW